MATTVVYSLCLLFLFCLIVQGSCCTGKDDLKVSQAKTGKLIKNKPEFNVTIYNDCTCSEVNVYLGPVEGFNTVEPIDPKILAKTPQGWLVSDGQPIYAHKSFSFTYAWDSQSNFVPVGATKACS
ncbi:hypothetical protein K2173_024052 [Erythroxylum novogranatense]|uniref:Uncharacterized protein n=1 Tax=Erythroxylum novogranatense TaxID=1862640 RepID=A0AAV8TQ68_9ROSI|nr:hypothetical protein K2173_024052 [Erythroxylum novogranatense]